MIVKLSLSSELSEKEKVLIRSIMMKTEKLNKDNISRTKAYERFFSLHPEIKWSFLAGMVSRNAGWNICDLEGEWLPRILSKQYRRLLFYTYERANWLIFHDAFPQLLLYHYSTRYRNSLFHLSRYFSISGFMEREWKLFLSSGDQRRLMFSQIINEQNLIESPVLENKHYKRNVFQTIVFAIQDHMHFSTVLFPTLQGDIYGITAARFRNLRGRIELGKQLALLLFSPQLFQGFYDFARKTEPTGSRHDYEQFFPCYKKRDTPFLRMTYPLITHSIQKPNQWDKGREIKDELYSVPRLPKTILLNSWYRNKQMQLHTSINIAEFILGKKST
jgi:hypothetical protein